MCAFKFIILFHALPGPECLLNPGGKRLLDLVGKLVYIMNTGLFPG